MVCNHDKSRKCGGPWRNTVVELKKLPYKPTKVGEKFVGCYADTGKRDLPTYISKNTNPTHCFKEAQRRGYKYAAMQYGTHCFAGHTVGKYGKKPDHECHMRCNHDKSRNCGGPWRNTVVELDVYDKKYKSTSVKE